MINNNDIENDLSGRTKKHWQNRANHRVQEYIRDLLKDEMDYSQQIIRDDCDVLVLLVGFTPDPLLQSIYMYRPRRLFLLLNHQYVDRDDTKRAEQVADEYQNYIGWMRELGYCRADVKPKPRQDIFWDSKEANSQWVFDTLCKHVLPEQRLGKRVIVDITGAKKNMVAGAYLFADYSGAEISYVDFKKYDSDFARPYGFTAFIELQPNPTKVLSLRDWMRVRSNIENFNFRNCARELKSIIVRMEGDYFREWHREAVKRLLDLTKIFEFWDNGDYKAAWEAKQHLEFSAQAPLTNDAYERILPGVIRLLAEVNWPSTTTDNPDELLQSHRTLKQGTTPQTSVFAQHEVFLGYVFDEYDKIGRLISPNEDYRSAFLRSAALHELLLKARLTIHWFHGNLKFTKENGQTRHRDDATFCYRALTEFHSAANARKFLIGEYSELRDATYYEEQIGQRSIKHTFNVQYKNRGAILNCQKLTYLNGSKMLDTESMEKIRNESIHTHLSIPLGLAQRAYALANAAIDDYLDNWVNKIPGQTYQRDTAWSPNWEELCTACEIDKFLPFWKPDNKLMEVKA